MVNNFASKVDRNNLKYFFCFRSKNDHPIVEDDHIKLDVTGDTVKLIITEVAPSDAGTYELVAENPLGSIDCSARLTVHCMKTLILNKQQKNLKNLF